VVLRDLRVRDGGLVWYGPDRRPQLTLAGVSLTLGQSGGGWEWIVKARRIQTHGPRPAAYGAVEVEGRLRPTAARDTTAFRFLGETHEVVFEGRGRLAPGSLALDQGRILVKPRDAAVEELTARVAFDSAAVRVGRLTGRVGRSRFALSATLAATGVSGLARAHLDLADLARLAPGAFAKASGRAQLALRWHGPAPDPDSLSCEGTVDLLGVGWQPPDPNAPPLAEVSGRVWADGRTATVSGLTGRWGPVPFRLSARLTRPLALASALDPRRRPDAPAAHAQFDLATGPIDAARLFPPGKPLAAPPALTAAGIVRAERLTAGRLDARAVVAEVRYDRGVADLDAARAQAYGGSVTGRGRFDLRDVRRPLYDLELQAQRLQAADLLAAWTPFPRLLTGEIDLRLGVEGSGLEARQALPGLALDGLARATGGRLAGSAVLAEAARWTGLAELGGLDFRDLLWRFRVERGRMRISETWLRTAGGDYSVGGEVGLDGTLALAVSAVLPASRLASLPAQLRRAAGFFQDEQGRALLDFGISGTVRAPRFAWRTDRAAARFAQRLESELRGRAAPYADAVQDSLARARAAVESRLATEAERARRALEESAARERRRLEERARGWLEGFLPGDSTAGAGRAAPNDTVGRADTAAAAPAPQP